MKFSSLSVNQVYEDTRGLIWIATREGINIYNPRTDELNILTEKDGLPSQFIAGVIEDDNKNMWISTARGVSNIIPEIDIKSSRYSYKCYTYDDKDGLQNCEYNQRSIKKMSTGEILIGGLYGLNKYKPDNIKFNTIPPKVLFTHFLLFNEEVEIGKKYNDRVILEKALNRTKQLELNYQQNIFSIMFASNNYVLPEKTIFQYKLEGFNNDWLTTNTGKITYTNLAPGTYTLKVKAINSDGYSSVDEAVMKIVINPPFWFTIWAYMLYVILIILILLLGRYIILRGERNRSKMEQIREIAKKNEELNDLKLRFFTNISHELRTPLTLILSPVEMLLKDYASDDILTDKLKMVQNNALRLMNLVNQLLDFKIGRAHV